MKRYELDDEQGHQIERAFLQHTPKEGWVERFAFINEKMVQTAKALYSVTPKCPEQTLALRKLQEAQHWFGEAIKKNES